MKPAPFAGIPADQGQALLQRLGVVWAMALLIALVQWSGHERARLDVHLVYSYAISTLIWAFTDLPRFVLRRWLLSSPPHYWPPVQRSVAMLLVGIPLGYVLGTWLGDRYAGHSTWALLEFNRQRFMGLMVSSMAISVAFVAYFYQRGKSEALARQVSEAQLRLLQTQLEPHMLFNTLAHLRAQVQLDPSQAVAMIDLLDDYLRRALRASQQAVQPLSQEFERLHDYLGLMQLRMGQRLRYSLDLPTPLAACPVPSLILQPLVENAIRHGLEPSVPGGTIQVRAWEADGHLQLEVRNTGAGFEPDADQPGYGLSHVRERLHTLWGQAAGFDMVADAEGGTRAHLHWPLPAGASEHPA